MEIAGLFGVKEGQPFMIDGRPGLFRIQNNELMHRVNTYNAWEFESAYLLHLILVKEVPDKIHPISYIGMKPEITRDIAKQIKAIITLGGRYLSLNANGVIWWDSEHKFVNRLPDDLEICSIVHPDFPDPIDLVSTLDQWEDEERSRNMRTIVVERSFNA